MINCDNSFRDYKLKKSNKIIYNFSRFVDFRPALIPSKSFTLQVKIHKKYFLLFYGLRSSGGSPRELKIVLELQIL